MRLDPGRHRMAALLLGAAVAGIGGGTVQGGDRVVSHKIKSASHSFVARSIDVRTSQANFEISAHGDPKITIALTGLAQLVDTARLTVANGILTIQDDSTRLDYTIVSDRQNIIVGSGNVIVNNIGPSSNSPRKNTSFSEKEMKLLPLTYKISAPKHIAVRMKRAVGRITLTGLDGAHRINLSGNGSLIGERLAGELTLHTSENTVAKINRAALGRLSVVAAENSEVDVSAVAKQTSFTVKGNAEVTFSGATDKADFSASENGTITASGTIKSVTRNKSGNAEIEIR